MVRFIFEGVDERQLKTRIDYASFRACCAYARTPTAIHYPVLYPIQYKSRMGRLNFYAGAVTPPRPSFSFFLFSSPFPPSPAASQPPDAFNHRAYLHVKHQRCVQCNA